MSKNKFFYSTCLAILGITLFGCEMVTDQAADLNVEKVDVCHLNSTGEYIKISVAEPAFETHVAHNDLKAGTGGLDQNCLPVDCRCFDHDFIIALVNEASDVQGFTIISKTYNEEMYGLVRLILGHPIEEYSQYPWPPPPGHTIFSADPGSCMFSSWHPYLASKTPEGYYANLNKGLELGCSDETDPMCLEGRNEAQACIREVKEAATTLGLLTPE